MPSLENTRRRAGGLSFFPLSLWWIASQSWCSPCSSRYLTTKPNPGATIPGAAASPETNDSEEGSSDGGRCSLGEQQHQQPLSSKEMLGGRGACRVTAPSIAPPKTKVSSDEEASERENAKRILRTLATHLWPSKELQVTSSIVYPTTIPGMNNCCFLL